MSDVINKRTERPCMHTFESQADRVIIETEGLDGYWLYATILKTLNDEGKKIECTSRIFHLCKFPMMINNCLIARL